MEGNNDRTFGPLQHWELNKAENYLHREAQRTVFADEITILTRDRETENPDKCLPRSSSLFRQCTFLDEAYVIRIRGRTQACAFITRDAAQPIVLPRDHPITTLILLDFHKRFNHQNHQTTINEVRQRYHIPKLKVAYKNARKGCQKCKNDQASAQPPIMNALPMQSLAAYTHSCLLAIRNIIARRGTPAVIFSDRGTNFQGASKELKAVLQNINQDQLVREFMTPNTEWTFIPPVSPHMGGAWERLIRTVKANLTKLQWGRLPTDEVLNNTLLEIENVVNSRPLTEIFMDNDESSVLTPNHFLLGSSNGLKPRVPYNDNPTVLRNSYKQSQIMANEFWRGWLRDYLPEITRRTKWFGKVKPIQVDDVVIIVDPNSPRNSLPLGRVIATRSAADGQVRSATVQTTRGIYERPAVAFSPYWTNKQPPSIALGIYITDFSFSHQIRANHLQASIAGQDATRVSTTAARGRTQVANAARLDGRAVCASLVLAGRHSKSQPSRSENNAAERLMEGKTPFHCLIESGQSAEVVVSV
ncbi:uncharacterized protein LOC134222429 [Armigeres subalbatus]|uniref:uncharacterized protein LOC134222429 n=1 Tax=Armigeres subalbatus TaxID=124917 RepID=UPI002ED3EDE1